MKVAEETPNFPNPFNQSPSILIQPKDSAQLPLTINSMGSASGHQHHYTIGIFGIPSDLCHTLVIGYQCYQSSDFDIGDYSLLFNFYPLTPMHIIPYCSFLSPHSHAHLMTL